MDIKELESFRLADAVKFHDKLNPALWTEKGTLDPEVYDKLMEIAKDFMAELGIPSPKVEDITISGSNAAYSYTPHSDLDLHILVDHSKLPDNDVYKELFNAKKTVYNDTHDIKVHGVPVELYVQDSNQPHHSLGEYSLLKKDWNKIPVKRRANFDQSATKAKYENLGELIELAIKTRSLKRVEKVIDIIKRYRKAGLEKTGEFGPENLAYKALRKQGLVQKLWDLKNELHSDTLSLEDYDPNGPPPGPEFKPTMPAGTVRVDVSDVYDWYKLGQTISNLGRADKSQFGKGPPSTIMAFGDEDLEHKYINQLMKLGLTTTDIDPASHGRMPGQKVDPTYNVNETFDKPYKLKWEKGDHGDVDAYAKMADGNYLSIMFNKGYSQGTKEEAWSVEFYRNNSQEVTGEGDAQRIFATVLSAIQTFIKKYKPNRVIFSASKEVEDGQKSQSRARLYDSLVQRYARAWGFRAFRADTGDKVIYELDRINKGVAEGGAETSWSDGNEKITLQDILELTKHIKQINLPINDNLKNKLIHWDGNPEEIERINQVTVSNQFPILVMVDEQGQIDWILDGNHRLHKAIKAQAKTIPAKLIKPSDLSDKAKRIFHIKEQGVAEARTNPEQNPKPESGFKELASIAKTINDPENWAISMTSEPKLGINPQIGISEDTPKGIYFYPLNYALSKTRYGKLPWGDNYPYIQLFKYDRSGEMTKQTKVDPAKLKKALLQYCPEEVIQQAIDDPEYDGTPYWFVYDCLSRLGKSDETNVVRWNKVLRELGFTSVYDDGDGWIAYNEPTQGVVLDPRIIKQHKTIINKQQSRVVTPAVIEQTIFETMDMELARNRAWQAYDPDGSKLRQAAKEYAKKPEFKQYYGKPGTEEIFNKAEGMGRYGARQLSDIAYEWWQEQKAQSKVNEASGYIPSEKEKNDPRFKTALTVDVHPDSIKKNAKAFNSKISRAGIPPKLNTNGKF